MSRDDAEEACELVIQHLTSIHQHQVEEYVQQQQQQQQQRGLPWDSSEDKFEHTHRRRRGPLCSSAVRTLHPVSRRCCGAARAGFTCLWLDRWCPQPQPQHLQLQHTLGVPFPWGLLAAAPAVTSISLKVGQLPALLAGPQEAVAALTGRLTALEVTGVGWREENHGGHISHYEAHPRLELEQVRALGCLLVACSRLRALRVVGRLSPKAELALEAALGVGAGSSSSGSQTPRAAPGSEFRQEDSQQRPVAPARGAATGSSSSSSGGSQAVLIQYLALRGLPYAPFHAWLRQRRQLGQLRSLVLDGEHNYGGSWPEVTGLQELHIGRDQQPLGGEGHGPAVQAGMAALSSSLTRLSLKGHLVGSTCEPDLAALTRLRQLELLNLEPGEWWTLRPLALSWVTALQQLTHLRISRSHLALPADLGQSLPGLEELLLEGCRFAGLGWPPSFPTGLTCLTRLRLYACERIPRAVESAVAGTSSLKHLDLKRCRLDHLSWLLPLSQLEVLVLATTKREQHSGGDASDSDGEEQPEGQEGSREEEAASAPHLVNLRHLDLSGSEWEVADLVTLCQGLQSLTSFNLAKGLLGESAERRERWRCAAILPLRIRRAAGSSPPWSDAGRLPRWSDAGSLPALGVFPALQQLSLAEMMILPSHWPGVGAWLGLQSQLVTLDLGGTKGPYRDTEMQQEAEGLAQLPTQLQQLNLRHCGLPHLPQCLTRLSGLKVLLVSRNREGLPAWLPALQQLEVVETGHLDPHKQQWLAQELPQLPRLTLLDDASRTGPWKCGCIVSLVLSSLCDQLLCEPLRRLTRRGDRQLPWPVDLDNLPE